MTPHPATGLIDVHSHLLYGIDDGCLDLHESLSCIKRLIQFGYTGTICTPHFWHAQYPLNTVPQIEGHVARLQSQIEDAGFNYKIWTGGELRLAPDSPKWLQNNPIPTLANSNYVLFDLWVEKWPKWANKSIEILLAKGYQPIMAHPERHTNIKKYDKVIENLTQQGILFQGNLQAFTGELGYNADLFAQEMLNNDKYIMLGLDMHQFETLDNRLDGVGLTQALVGEEKITQLLSTNIRQMIFQE